MAEQIPFKENNLKDNPNINLILVDDHRVFIDGLQVALSSHPCLRVISTFNDGKSAFEYIKQHSEQIDLVITDISMPLMNGIELIRSLRDNEIVIKTLVVTMFNDFKAIDYIDGYILKESTIEEVFYAIDKIVNEHERYISPEISQFLQENHQKNDLLEDQLNLVLTKREKDIIRLISKEYTTLEIAEQLFVSKHTVESHRKNIFLKLNVKNIAGLTKKAFLLGIIK